MCVKTSLSHWGCVTVCTVTNMFEVFHGDCKFPTLPRGLAYPVICILLHISKIFVPCSIILVGKIYCGYIISRFHRLNILAMSKGDAHCATFILPFPYKALDQWQYMQFIILWLFIVLVNRCYKDDRNEN